MTGVGLMKGVVAKKGAEMRGMVVKIGAVETKDEAEMRDAETIGEMEGTDVSETIGEAEKTNVIDLVVAIDEEMTGRVDMTGVLQMTGVVR